MISDITDRLLPQIEEWQKQPLDEVYPKYLDKLQYPLYTVKKSEQLIFSSRSNTTFLSQLLNLQKFFRRAEKINMIYFISTLFFLLGAWITFANWVGIYRYYKYKKHSSSIPLFGGLFLFISLIIIIKTPYKALSFIPFILDYGSFPLMIHTIWFLIKNKNKK